MKTLLSRLLNTVGKLSSCETGEAPKDLAPIILRMAQTGEGTDECLRLGCLPVPVHFYSPMPDIKDLEQRNVWERKSPLAGIDFRTEEQVEFMKRLGRSYGDECAWPENATKDPFQFHTHNGCFGFGCAAMLHCMIRHHKPRRLIEIGSGYSSLVISAALRRNADESPKHSCHYAIVDPYPGETIQRRLPLLSEMVKKRAELVPAEFFDTLKDNDILFVDSSHTVRIGGDVNHLILDILPNLSPGVVVHFHDIHLPYEYHRVYATNPAFRVFWTEAYLLQAFLAHNNHWEILLGMAYLMAERMSDFESAFPHFDIKKNWSNSGSFWIRRKSTHTLSE